MSEISHFSDEVSVNYDILALIHLPAVGAVSDQKPYSSPDNKIRYLSMRVSAQDNLRINEWSQHSLSLLSISQNCMFFSLF